MKFPSFESMRMWSCCAGSTEGCSSPWRASALGPAPPPLRSPAAPRAGLAAPLALPRGAFSPLGPRALARGAGMPGARSSSRLCAYLQDVSPQCPVLIRALQSFVRKRSGSGFRSSRVCAKWQASPLEQSRRRWNLHILVLVKMSAWRSSADTSLRPPPAGAFSLGATSFICCPGVATWSPADGADAGRWRTAALPPRHL
mmetsp:Transcript_18167/g.39906  ORF Transcript_18167/g.39906 Transcript_18167/m.39906 type:complete len:200 (+) Transcript_18167:794-1393(+)